MQSKRTVFLMAVLLALLASYFALSYWNGLPGSGKSMQAVPLPGKNEISNVQVSRDSKGRWMVTLDYFFTGAPTNSYINFIVGGELRQDGLPGALMPPVNSFAAKKGAQQVVVELKRPRVAEPVITHKVSVQLVSPQQQVLASREIEQKIDWPDIQAWMIDHYLAEKSDDEILAWAVEQIDSGGNDQLLAAKRQLERLLGRNPQYDPAYVELARTSMKLAWGAEGLHQAEALLASALHISPDSSNAKILLGYVYTHQRRYKAAEELFNQAAKSETNNVWLWANWGEVLAMQGKMDLAIEKYQTAIQYPPTKDTYNRARLDAYQRLLILLEHRKDYAGLDTVHKLRVAESGPGSCYNIDYARFLLRRAGDTVKAIELASRAIDSQCTNQYAREVLGAAYYLAWANESGTQKSEFLNKARVFMPANPRLFYLLASSDLTAVAAKQLVAAGELIDQKDNQMLNALAIALQAKDRAAIRRLLQLGAKPNAVVGLENIPVALLPVMGNDIEGVRHLQQSGVDYSKIKYQGMTAFDYASQVGNGKLLQALSAKGAAL